MRYSITPINFHPVMVKVEGLTYSFGVSRIRYPDFQIDTGGQFLIQGNSGTGKTTLLHLIAGLRKAQEGSIRIENTDITSLNERERDNFRGKNIGIVFQQPHLLSALSVRENLLAGQFFASSKQDVNRVEEVLSELNLSDRAGARPHQISQGEAQRVAIARALMNRPTLLMADEPTSSLDDENCQQVLKLLVNNAKRCKASLIVVSHDQRVEECIKDGIKLNQR